MVDLSGRTAIVTGGTKGIGRAIAGALVGAGAAVVIASRTREDVERVAAELTERGPGRARGVAADVGRYEDCRQMVAAAVEAYGRLDILVNNAGIGIMAPVAELTPEDWDRTIATNLSALFYCSHAAIPHLKDAGDAWIINIGSLSATSTYPGGGAYSASKWGPLGLTETMMKELRHDGVRVSTILPGSVATSFGPGAAAEWKIQPEDVAEALMDLLAFPPRTNPSRIEMRPAQPPKR